MKSIIAYPISICLILMLSVPAFGKGKPAQDTQNTPSKVKQFKPATAKGAKIKPGPFRVNKVEFKEITVNGQQRLAAAVVFNRNVAKASVKPNVNIRLLIKNSNHQWVDVATQNNKVNVRPNFVTWVSGAPLLPGFYIMHLRGTIKSADGVYLDCNGDGKGEGGNLPPFESQMHEVKEGGLIRIDPEKVDEQRRQQNR